jgi:diguanylate cyclase (GGDEF)-like protein/PAS domain S-box-containing protein
VPASAVRAAGECFPAELWITTYELDGRMWYTVFVRDITERTAAIEALAEHERRYRELVETVPAVVYRAPIDLDSDATYVSPQIEALLGRTPEEWTGTPGIWRSHIHPEDIEASTAMDQAAIDGNGDRSVTEYRMTTRSGATIWVRDVATVVRDAAGRPLSWSGYLTDITDRKQLEEELVQQAFRDPLTGLANRSLFADRVRHAVERHATSSAYVGMLMIDLDEFKTVNDTLGHAAGDQLLTEVGQRLRTGVGIGATVARLGGDEFAVLLEDLPDEAAAISVATRLIRAVEAPVRIGTNQIQVRASIGIAVDLGRRGTAEWLFRSADVAVYEAKRRGRGQWKVYDPATYLAATKRAAVESGLRRAVERGQFDVLYQPIIALDTTKVIGAEALVRWRHPSRGEIPPAEFLGIAEKTGLILQIGTQVLDRVCGELRTCADAYPSFRTMTINVSGRQLESAALVGQVRDALAKHGANPSLLVLEVTESIALDEDGPTLDRLRALKQLGVRIAIDDFGTGYSSLAYLRRLPVDILKIDRSFIENLADTPDAVAVARTIVDLAKTLRLTVVAEGIEHRAQEAVVRELGCDLAQGFLFAKPLKPGELRDLLALQHAQGLRAVS